MFYQIGHLMVRTLRELEPQLKERYDAHRAGIANGTIQPPRYRRTRDDTYKKKPADLPDLVPDTVPRTPASIEDMHRLQEEYETRLKACLEDTLPMTETERMQRAFDVNADTGRKERKLIEVKGRIALAQGKPSTFDKELDDQIAVQEQRLKAICQIFAQRRVQAEIMRGRHWSDGGYANAGRSSPSSEEQFHHDREVSAA